jgi:hypothetical protein
MTSLVDKRAIAEAGARETDHLNSLLALEVKEIETLLSSALDHKGMENPLSMYIQKLKRYLHGTD